MTAANYGQVSIGRAPNVEHGRDLTWQIVMPPHVMVRFKRVFERVYKGSHGFALLRATPENTRELQWFLERYPMEMSEAARETLVTLAGQHRLREEAINLAIAGRAPLQRSMVELAFGPRDYQEQFVAIAEAGPGGVLNADALGLGKTAMAIYLVTRHLPALVVTQAHLQTQWRDEFRKFAPGLRVHVAKTGKPYEVRGGVPDVMIMSYAKSNGWADWAVKRYGARSAAFDEAQELRHATKARGETTIKYGAASYICKNVERRVGLTATPVYNYGGEIYNIIDCLQPDALGSRSEFEREWCKGNAGGDKARIEDPEAFTAYLREQGLMVRRTRAQVGRSLPGGDEPLRIPHTIDCDLDGLREVERSVAELARLILQQGGSGLEKMRASEELDWRMRQATGIAKAPHVAEFVRLLLDSEAKVTLFGWHHEVYSIWKDKLKDFNPVFYTGQESVRAKDEAKAKFISDPTCRVFVMSLRSGAGLEGIQKVCRVGVFGEFDWAPGVHRQCEGRFQRDDQIDRMLAYYLATESGSDPVMLDVLGVKRPQVDGMLGVKSEAVPGGAEAGHIKRLAESVLQRRSMRA